MRIPKIDLTIDDDKFNAQQIVEAISSFGAFYVKTDFGKEAHEQLFRSAQTLFQVDQSIKDKISIGNSGFARGYIKIGGESGSNGFEKKEGYSYGYQVKSLPKNKLQGVNIWPDSFDHSNLDDFFNYSDRVSKKLILLLSLRFIGNRTWLDHCKDGETISIMRIFHYLADISSNSLGSSAHTDWGFITLIKALEKSPALQIAENVDGKLKWHDIPACPPDEADGSDWWIVNAGDFLTMISKGKILSPLHRVVSTSNERMSFVYFAYPTYESTVPEFFSENLSLLQNQKKVLEGKKDIVPTIDCFGDFILEKWSQVNRY